MLQSESSLQRVPYCELSGYANTNEAYHQTGSSPEGDGAFLSMSAVTFIVIGALYLIDKLIHFSTIGLPWVMNKDNMLLYASICFLIFKRDKSIGFVLLGLWLVMNISLVISLLGSLSGYLLPLTLLIVGIILFWFAKR